MEPKAGQKTVLITGCTPGGIGAALVEEFHKRGLFVIATARKLEVLKEFADQGIATVALDVTNAESIAKCKDEVDRITSGKLDILINNAGLTHTVPATDIDLNEVRQTFEANVFGVMAMNQALIGPLIAAQGLIVNISSLSAITPYVFGSVYCATKGAINSYSRTLRQELRPLGVRVMVSVTGTVKTHIAKLKRTLPEGSLYAPLEDVYQWRLNYSQSRSPQPAPAFAAELADAALRQPGWFSAGPPDWFYGGNSASAVRALTSLGEWASDFVLSRHFRVPEMITRMDAYRRQL